MAAKNGAGFGRIHVNPIGLHLTVSVEGGEKDNHRFMVGAQITAASFSFVLPTIHCIHWP